MTHHQLKLSDHFWDAVMSGEKNFEVRKNDRGFQKGDEVTFFAVLDGLVDYSTPSPLFKITYVLSGWGIESDHVVFGIQLAEPSKTGTP